MSDVQLPKILIKKHVYLHNMEKYCWTLDHTVATILLHLHHTNYSFLESMKLASNLSLVSWKLEQVENVEVDIRPQKSITLFDKQ